MSKFDLEMEHSDQIGNYILNKLGKCLLNVVFFQQNRKEIIFKFISPKNQIQIEKFPRFLLYNHSNHYKIFCFEYIKRCVFIYNINDKYYKLLYIPKELVNILTDLSCRTENFKMICLILKKGNKHFIYRYFLYNSFLKKENELSFYTEIQKFEGISKALEKQMTFIELNSNYFILFSKKEIRLFEKCNNQSFLIHFLDISFTKNVYPIIFQENICFISSHAYIYQIKISKKKNDNISIFKDLTLNFNNEKYRDLLETLKLILYYNLEVDKLEFQDLPNIMESIFHEQDIFSYTHNLSNVLNEENILFFISHNLSSSKIQILFLYSLIFDNLNFFSIIYQTLLKLDKLNFRYLKTGHMHFSTKEQKFPNQTFFVLLITMVEFFSDFFKEFQIFNLKATLEPMLYNIFKDFQIQKFIQDYLNK
jgi:hypothetical protein